MSELLVRIVTGWF